MTKIHSTAIIDPKAEIDESATIEAYSVIGADVKIGPECIIGPHAVITGPTTIGARTRVYQFASLGEDPQDLKYKGERTELIIGEGNVIREHVTMNRGTVGGGGVTKIGNGCLFMAASHAAHDTMVGDRVVVANYAGLTGHVIVEDGVIIGGQSGIHQFVRLGRGAFLAGNTMCYFDVPPYCRASGDRAALYGLNVIGMQRAGIPNYNIGELQKAYGMIIRASAPIVEAIEQVRSKVDQVEQVVEFVEFCAASERGITREK